LQVLAGGAVANHAIHIGVAEMRITPLTHYVITEIRGVAYCMGDMLFILFLFFKKNNN
jgi:hypothetical protein